MGFVFLQREERYFMCPKTNYKNLVADEVINSVYDYFKSRNPVFPFPDSLQARDILYDFHDSHEGRRYVVGMDYHELVSVDNFLIAKGTGFGVRLPSIGDCLLVIPLKKDDKVDDYIKDCSRIKTRNYHAIYSYRGKLHTPYQLTSGINPEISFVLDVFEKGFLPNAEVGWLRYYTSALDNFDASIIDSLITAFKCSLGIDSKKTKKLSQEIEVVHRQKLLVESPKENIFDEIKSLINTLEFRVNSFGESEFTPTINFLRSEIGKLEMLVDS